MYLDLSNKQVAILEFIKEQIALNECLLKKF